MKFRFIGKTFQKLFFSGVFNIRFFSILIILILNFKINWLFTSFNVGLLSYIVDIFWKGGGVGYLVTMTNKYYPHGFIGHVSRKYVEIKNVSLSYTNNPSSQIWKVYEISSILLITMWWKKKFFNANFQPLYTAGSALWIFRKY